MSIDEARKNKPFVPGVRLLPAVAEGSEASLGLGLVWHRQRQRKALEARPALALTVGGQDRGVADAQARMHDLVFGTRLDHGGVRALLVTPEHRDLGAEGSAGENHGLLAAHSEEDAE